MYEYKTEIIGGSLNLFSNKANSNDLVKFNNIFNEYAAEGWDIVTYCYMSEGLTSVKGDLLATFRRKK